MFLTSGEQIFGTAALTLLGVLGGAALGPSLERRRRRAEMRIDAVASLLAACEDVAFMSAVHSVEPLTLRESGDALARINSAVARVGLLDPDLIVPARKLSNVCSDALIALHEETSTREARTEAFGRVRDESNAFVALCVHRDPTELTVATPAREKRRRRARRQS